MTTELLAEVKRSARRQREWTARRNQAIRDAVEAGASLRQVAESAGLSPSGIRKIVERT